MTKTLAGTWLAEVRDDSLWDREPYYPSLDEGYGMVLNGEWPDALWALLNHLSDELANVTSRTCGLRDQVDPDGSLDRLETRLMSALKSLRRAEPYQPWEFEMDGCRYRLFIAGAERAASPSPVEVEAIVGSLAADAFSSWVSPQIVPWGDPTRRPSRRRRAGGHR